MTFFWERAVHSMLVLRECFKYVCFLPFGHESEMRDLILLIPDYCLFTLT